MRSATARSCISACDIRMPAWRTRVGRNHVIRSCAVSKRPPCMPLHGAWRGAPETAAAWTAVHDARTRTHTHTLVFLAIFLLASTSRVVREAGARTAWRLAAWKGAGALCGHRARGQPRGRSTSAVAAAFCASEARPVRPKHPVVATKRPPNPASSSRCRHAWPHQGRPREDTAVRHPAFPGCGAPLCGVCSGKGNGGAAAAEVGAGRQACGWQCRRSQ